MFTLLLLLSFSVVRLLELTMEKEKGGGGLTCATAQALLVGTKRLLLSPSPPPLLGAEESERGKESF